MASFSLSFRGAFNTSLKNVRTSICWDILAHVDILAPVEIGGVPRLGLALLVKRHELFSSRAYFQSKTVRMVPSTPWLAPHAGMGRGLCCSYSTWFSLFVETHATTPR